jgi:CheY-like chemotaxis protein
MQVIATPREQGKSAAKAIPATHCANPPDSWRDALDPPVRVLIVDDDQICREVLRDALDQLGVEMELAGDGVEGLEKLSAKPFDLLITDLNMPRMDGLGLLREARHRYPHILTIVITGYGSLESAVEAIRQGTYDYIQKPFRIDEIVLVTRNAVERIIILREKNRILQELTLAHRRLAQYEQSEKHRQEDALPASEERQGEGLDTLCLFPRHTAPLAVFERPSEGASRVLSALERLRDLRRQGVIDDREMERLKKKILSQSNEDSQTGG